MDNIDICLKSNQQYAKTRAISKLIELAIKTLAADDNPETSSKVNNLYDRKNTIEDRMRYKNAWEKTETGYEKRTNFRYDEISDTIIFDRNKIFKKKDKFITDGSKVSEEFISKHGEELRELIELENEISEYFTKYGITTEELRKVHSSGTIYETIDAYDKATIVHYIKTYGTSGVYLLVKYLNLISEDSISEYLLMEEYYKDISSVQLPSNNNYNVLAAFEHLFIKVISMYSPRGETFAITCKDYRVYMQENNKRMK